MALANTKLLHCTQVNTSGEESKYGVEPGDCVPLAAHIARKCSNLRLAGLMTIGMPDYSSRPENFTCLAQCRWACFLPAMPFSVCLRCALAETATALRCLTAAGMFKAPALLPSMRCPQRGCGQGAGVAAREPGAEHGHVWRL